MSGTNGRAIPPRFDPPPQAPMTTSGQPFAGQHELLLGLEADHGLVQQDVVEDGAERVVRVRPGGRVAHRVADRRAERSGVVRVVDRRRDDLATPDLHHHPSVRLLFVRRPDHVDLAFEAEQRRGERQRAPPLAGAGLRRQSGDAFLLVVERLGYRGVRLVRSGRRDRLVLVVDAGRRTERPLEPLGPDERRRPPQAQDVEHLAGHVDPRLGRDLLADERHREQRRQVVRADRLPGPRVEGRLQRFGQVRGHVEPRRRDPVRSEVPPHGALPSPVDHPGPPSGRYRAARNRRWFTRSSSSCYQQFERRHPGGYRAPSHLARWPRREPS